MLFPSGIHQWVSPVTDTDLHHAMVRAYNDWVSEFCSFAPDHLGGTVLLPNRGIEGAAPEDDALWARIEESGLPLTIHVGLGNTFPGELKAQGLPGTVHFYDAPQRMLQFIFGGVLDRFPGLTIVMTEVDCGWLPYFSEQADDNYAVENRHRIGVERMLWSNDYPHITSDWPMSWKTINASFADVPPHERHAILSGNAQRIFGFGR